ncbi:hypothetical protein ACLB2K_047911 [Fragaria x ananassa]
MKKRRSHRERVLLPMRGHWTRAQKKERGITMSVAVAYFDSKKYKVVVLDSPGHRDFVPNMISGATQADAAILVVDGSHGAFEAGMKGGQTKEHAQIIKSFGVKQIVVAVNKMDVVGYSKDRFDEIEHTLGTYLSRSCRFEESAVCWVPLSAMENQNMVSAPGDERLLSRYSRPCLLEAIDSFQPPKRESEKSLLMPICDVIKSSRGQVSACGKLQAGTLQNGIKVRVMPSGELGTVRSLERDGSQSYSTATAGDNVAVTLQGIADRQVMAGGVLCGPDVPVAFARHLELNVQLLDGAQPLLVGSQLEFQIHHAKEAARVVKIAALLDPNTLKVAKKSPRCLLAKQVAVVEVVVRAIHSLPQSSLLSSPNQVP